MLKRKKANGKMPEPNFRISKCALCGKAGVLIKTPCCNQWVCIDANPYIVPRSLRGKDCYKKHGQYTLCSFHHGEKHSGKWQDCPKCRRSFETEMYAYFGTNKYNFEKLANPPDYEPARCSKCNAIIILSQDEYSEKGDKKFCARCADFD